MVSVFLFGCFFVPLMAQEMGRQKGRMTQTPTPHPPTPTIAQRVEQVPHCSTTSSIKGKKQKKIPPPKHTLKTPRLNWGGLNCTIRTHCDAHSPVPSVLTLQFWDRLGCDRNALNGALVTSPADSEVAVLAPAGSPAVLNDPVLLAGHVALAVAHQKHSVVGQLERIEGVSEARVVVDALLVVHEVRVDLGEERGSLLPLNKYTYISKVPDEEQSYLKSHCHGPILDQFHHHGCLAAAAVKPTDVVVFSCVNVAATLRDATWAVLCNIWEA